MTFIQFTVLFFCVLIFGTMTGAYFGTAEYRIRYGEPLLTSRCYCPSCHQIIPEYDQIPIISWLMLHGKCRHCGSAISVRYPLLEGGFLVYYGIIFCMFYQSVPSMLALWFFFLTILLTIRCHGHWSRLLRGLAVFAGYHGIFGMILTMIYSALGLT